MGSQTAQVPIAEWIDDDGEPIGPIGLSEPIYTAGSIKEVSEWCAHQVEKAQAVEAARGPRFGQSPGQAQRAGSLEDVVAPVYLSPKSANRWAISGEIFEPALPLLDIEFGSLESAGRSCSWQATVRTGRFSRRPATLRIDPSPSGVFTILQLVPTRPRTIRTGSFITAGVIAIGQLSDRLASKRWVST